MGLSSAVNSHTADFLSTQFKIFKHRNLFHSIRHTKIYDDTPTTNVIRAEYENITAQHELLQDSWGALRENGYDYDKFFERTEPFRPALIPAKDIPDITRIADPSAKFPGASRAFRRLSHQECTFRPTEDTTSETHKLSRNFECTRR